MGPQAEGSRPPTSVLKTAWRTEEGTSLGSLYFQCSHVPLIAQASKIQPHFIYLSSMSNHYFYIVEIRPSIVSFLKADTVFRPPPSLSIHSAGAPTLSNNCPIAGGFWLFPSDSLKVNASATMLRLFFFFLSSRSTSSR